jgi:hypothetical protein
MANTLTDTLTSLMNHGRVRATLSTALRGWRRARFRWWYVPLATVLLAVFGWLTNDYLERAIKSQKAAEMRTLLDAEATALDIWLGSQKAFASVVASDPVVVRYARELLQVAGGPEQRAGLTDAPAQAALRAYLRPIAEAQGYVDFVVTSPGGLIVAAAVDPAVGNPALTRHFQFIAPALAGLTMVSRPFRAEVPLPDDTGQLVWGRPTMFVGAPILDEQGTVLAALGLRIRPEIDFTRILNVARPGETGETYAFDANGLMVSQSRFDGDLRRIGLLPQRQDVRAILTVEIRDPGGDLSRGYVPELPRPQQPLTRMAQAAVTGQSGVDVDGYRDYRGVEVIGAWRWLEEYGFGVATEMDVSEAFAVLSRVRLAFRLVFGFLVVASIGVVLSTVVISRIGSEADAAIAKALRLGQYTLEEKIGEGGMGEVYRARHAMLRRPTAIKLLRGARASDRDLARFEQEVQITSRLTHPNTVAIYDYGHTPEGVFYYVMEYLPGLSIERMVELEGPLPAARVIYLLQQVCGSLAEAHGAGLIHRDIKPANVIVCERGGIYDVAKVLDFGIARDMQGKATATDAGVSGTPMFMSPEALRGGRAIDIRSDIYSLGASAYFMVCGEHPFDGDSAAEIAAQHLRDIPPRPSERAAVSVPADLEALIMRCLAKEPDDRPASVEELSAELAACAAAAAWSQEAARHWWQDHAEDVATLLEAGPDAGQVAVRLATRPS